MNYNYFTKRKNIKKSLAILKTGVIIRLSNNTREK